MYVCTLIIIIIYYPSWLRISLEAIRAKKKIFSLYDDDVDLERTWLENLNRNWKKIHTHTRSSHYIPYTIVFHSIQFIHHVFLSSSSSSFANNLHFFFFANYHLKQSLKLINPVFFSFCFVFFLYSKPSTLSMFERWWWWWWWRPRSTEKIKIQISFFLTRNKKNNSLIQARYIRVLFIHDLYLYRLSNFFCT